MKKSEILIFATILIFILTTLALNVFTEIKILTWAKNSLFSLLKIKQELNPEEVQKSLNIFIRPSGFVPNFNSLPVGATVNWINEDVSAHTVTTDSWNSGSIEPGSKFTKKFKTAGQFQYHCSFHPETLGTLFIQ